MSKRDIVSRYKGSFIGIFWSLINPIFMLTVYTFVFSVVFKARWGQGTADEPKTQFALILFVGMIIHGFLAENLMRAPGLILQHANYVKKVIFPLEILPVVMLLSVLFHTIISFLVLILAFTIFNGIPHWTIVLAPLIFLPLIIFTVSASWFLSALGVYMRDIGQIIGIVSTLLLFLAPVFYPLSALPPEFQHIVMLNPLTFIIEESRKVIIWGGIPDFKGLMIYTAASLVCLWLSYIWFQKTRKGFADVI
ncbi:ABC transporter permease [Phytobacter massiliensis]|nr:ABC transporter permease [Phytobacter massiliensis]